MVTLREHEGYDPDWIRGTFTVRGQCENPTCRQVMYGTGDYSVSDSTTFDWDGSQWTGPAYSAFYTVTHLHPPVLIMSIPSSAPLR